MTDRADKPKGLEVRAIPLASGGVATRADGDGTGPGLIGYGSVYEATTTIGGWYSFDEVVAAGTWAKTIGEGDIRSMFNHDTNFLLGRVASGSLHLAEDDTGLRYEVDINVDDSQAMSVHAKVARGDVSGSSVWFRVVREEWTEPTEDNGLERPLRRILEAQLFEVGPVVFPAFEATTVAARSIGALDGALRAAGVDDTGRRARLAADILADPAGAEDQLRHLLAQAPELRNAICACSPQDHPGRAAPAPGHPTGTPPDGHLPAHTRARATASRYGLTLKETTHA